MSDTASRAPAPVRARLRAAAPWLVVVAVLVAAPFMLSDFWLKVGLFSMAAAVVAIGLNLLFGTAGQLSLGHGIFVAIGSYGYIVLSSPPEEIGNLSLVGANLPPALAAILAVLLAGLGGLLLSPITRRLRGLSLAVATLGLVFVTSHVLANAQSLSGGFNGRAVEPLTVLGIPFGDPTVTTAYGAIEMSGNQQLWLLMVAVVLVGGWLAHNIINSRQGRAMQAVRDQQLAAGVLGVEVTRYKAQAFFVSALYAGAGGVLIALAFGQIVPDYFELFLSINFVVMVVIGGLNSVPGALIGALIVTALPEALSHYGDAIPFVASGPGESGLEPGVTARYLYGAAIVAILIAEPDGVVGLWRRLRRLGMRRPAGGMAAASGLSPPKARRGHGSSY